MHMVQAKHSYLFVGLAVAALSLAGCTAPKEPLAATSTGTNHAGLPESLDPGAPTGGGRVLNTAPRVVEFRGSLEHGDNGGGSVETFLATVADDNAEGDLASLSLTGDGPEPFSSHHTIARADLAERNNPGAAEGWTVWDAVPQDGLLQLAVRFAYPYGAATGDYRWTLTVRDASGAGAASEEDHTILDPVHVVEVVGAVTADGAPAPADGWGGWSAAPGARDVPSVTFLKVVNKGTAAGQRFLVDFTSRDFIGSDDRDWRVPLDGNVRFAAWEAGEGQLPRDGSFVFGDPSPDGSAAFTFARAGGVLYVAYEVVQVPTPLPSQVYGASATVTAL
jgi:hypothetical protein